MNQIRTLVRQGGLTLTECLLPANGTHTMKRGVSPIEHLLCCSRQSGTTRHIIPAQKVYLRRNFRLMVITFREATPTHLELRVASAQNAGDLVRILPVVLCLRAADHPPRLPFIIRATMITER